MMQFNLYYNISEL